MKVFFVSLLFSTIIWLLNLQFNPKIGNVWIRPDESGKRVFCPKSIISLLIAPFQNLYFWYPKNWDLNFYTIFGITYLIISIIDIK